VPPATPARPARTKARWTAKRKQAEGGPRKTEGGPRKHDRAEPGADRAPRKREGSAAKTERPARKQDGPRTWDNAAPKTDRPARTWDNAAPKNDRPARKHDGPRTFDNAAPKTDRPARKHDGPRTFDNAAPKTDRPDRTWDNAAPKNDRPARKDDRPRTYDSAAPTTERPARTRDRAAPRSQGPARSYDAPRSKYVSVPRKDDRAATPASGAPATPDTGVDLDAALTAAALLPEPPTRTFAQLGLPDRAVSILATRGVHEPFAIQARALPSALAGRDILARAATGCGKTLAFGLPMLVTLANRADPVTPHLPRGLVLAPTRELAKQIADALEPVASGLNLRVAAVFGGAPIGKQIDRFRRGVDVVIATPGRLIDLMERGTVCLDEVAIAVVDEADHMADMGFMDEVTRILDATPHGRQCMLFSATLDRRVQGLATRYLVNPDFHAVSQPDADRATMAHLAFTLAPPHKVDVAAELAARPARTLFFVKTKHGADDLAGELRRRGVEAAAIHGNLNQSQRLRVLAAFAEGRTRVMVATDVAARGLHIPDVDLVVHYDPPHDHKDYLHRSGRTARAGASGTVLSLVENSQRRKVARIHSDAGVTAETTAVIVGHPAVRAVAESGEPIVVVVPPPTPIRGAKGPKGRDVTSPRRGRDAGGSRRYRSMGTGARSAG
jgi:superfamily II DNA/RNA helicase